MRSPLVIGNWKMNGRLSDSGRLVADLLAVDSNDWPEVAVCPPFPFLQMIKEQLAGSEIKLGAQNVSQFSDGAYTGEVSVGMLKDVGCEYVLVGHSERRQLFGETSQQVFEKARLALDAGLAPVVCVGETQGEREAGKTESVITGQLEQFASSIGSSVLAGCVLAYEPIWAIGTGLAATPAQAQDAHSFIREFICESAGMDASVNLRILYGGSLKPANAVELFAMPDIDGGLVGGASLIARDFLAILESAQSA